MLCFSPNVFACLLKTEQESGLWWSLLSMADLYSSFLLLLLLFLLQQIFQKVLTPHSALLCIKSFYALVFIYFFFFLLVFSYFHAVLDYFSIHRIFPVASLSGSDIMITIILLWPCNFI
ncbi:hypothetical protein ACH5RR_024296 [Cinchona calisaya]|uniref:Uncharacterized protein n=1 Tax=Cinchona calisaya TaxID=153742 RepID=A0ABD2YXG7_9GENT